MKRRSFLQMMALGVFPVVVPGRKLQFPRDHGAHPDFRTEWWYLTGWLEGPLGFQVTFFRARNKEASGDNPSRFNPQQILLAHAAVSDPQRGHLIHDERAARAGFSLAEAETERTGVWIDDWRLEQNAGRYRAQIKARDFALDLEFISEKLVLQGDAGFSRKGRRSEEASYYYSRPQLNVAGKLNGRDTRGSAWLDHEWSSAYLAPEAAGWDWTGINLLDGSSLMAFQMRARQGGIHYAPPGVSFEVLRKWQSPRTGVEYPVSMRVTADGRKLRLEPLMDDQELDARASTGTIYWEGAVRALDERNNLAGHGYLELTGYWKPMTL